MTDSWNVYRALTLGIELSPRPLTFDHVHAATAREKPGEQRGPSRAFTGDAGGFIRHSVTRPFMFQCFESVECSLPIGGDRGRYGAVIWTWPRPCIREPFGVVVRAAASGCLLSLPAEHTGERTRGICTSWSRFFLFGRDGGGRSLVGFRAREKQCGHDSLSCLPAGARSLAQSRRLRHSRAGVSPVSRFPRRPVCSILDSVWNWAGRRFQIRAAARRSAARAVGSRADRRSRGVLSYRDFEQTAFVDKRTIQECLGLRDLAMATSLLQRCRRGR